MSHNREPIGNTCKTIDKYIKSINAATYRHLEDLEPSTLLEYAQEMSSELDNCENYLEDMRSANATLRDWGCEEANQVDYLEGKLSYLESEVDNLQDEIKSLKKEVDRLEGKVDSLEEDLQSTKSDLEWYEDKHK